MMRRQYTAEQRQRLVSEVRSSGEGVAAVAKRLGVAPSSAYLWLKEAAAGTPTFVRVFASASEAGSARSSVMIEVSGATIRVEQGFDAELLRSVVAALGTGS